MKCENKHCTIEKNICYVDSLGIYLCFDCLTKLNNHDLKLIFHDETQKDLLEFIKDY